MSGQEVVCCRVKVVVGSNVVARMVLHAGQIIISWQRASNMYDFVQIVTSCQELPSHEIFKKLEISLGSTNGTMEAVVCPI